MNWERVLDFAAGVAFMLGFLVCDWLLRRRRQPKKTKSLKRPKTRPAPEPKCAVDFCDSLRDPRCVGGNCTHHCRSALYCRGVCMGNSTTRAHTQASTRITVNSREVRADELPPWVAEALGRGVLSAEQMNDLLRTTGHDVGRSQPDEIAEALQRINEGTPDGVIEDEEEDRDSIPPPKESQPKTRWERLIGEDEDVPV